MRGHLKKLKLPKLPKIKLPFKRKIHYNDNHKKRYPNPVCREWCEKITEEMGYGVIRNLVMRYIAILLVISLSIAASSVVFSIYCNRYQKEIDDVITKTNGILNEYGNILGDIDTYEKYASMRINPPLYIQYVVLGTSASKFGFFIDKMNFEKTKDLGGIKESFAVETGKSPDSVNIVGIWKFNAWLVREGDSRWVLSLREGIDGMFSLYGARAYTSAVLRDKNADITVVVWNE